MFGQTIAFAISTNIEVMMARGLRNVLNEMSLIAQ